MGDYADDAWDPGDPKSWYDATPRIRRPRATNKEIFREFAHPENGLCKAGQRVVHIPSGVAGEVLSVRGDLICWRPDTRIKPGGIWVDISKVRVEI